MASPIKTTHLALPQATRRVGTFGLLSLILVWMNPVGLLLSVTTFALLPAARKERSTLRRLRRDEHDRVVRRSIWFASISAALQILTLAAAFTYRAYRRKK